MCAVNGTSYGDMHSICHIKGICKVVYSGKNLHVALLCIFLFRRTSLTIPWMVIPIRITRMLEQSPLPLWRSVSCDRSQDLGSGSLEAEKKAHRSGIVIKSLLYLLIF